MSKPSSVSNHASLEVGGLVAIYLSGIAFVQVVVYFYQYPKDPRGMKAFVLGVYFMDTCHSALVCAALWYFFVASHVQNIANVNWILAFSVAFTALITFSVHCFLTHRIYRLSKEKWYIAVPIGIATLVPLCAGLLFTIGIIRVRPLSAFTLKYGHLVTFFLASASALDIVIAAFLCYFLRESRTSSTSTRLRRILDTLILYAMASGALTCVTSIISMICWLTMSDNRVFLAVLFAISKLYANSVLANLNTRNRLRDAPQAETPSAPQTFAASFSRGLLLRETTERNRAADMDHNSDPPKPSASAHMNRERSSDGSMFSNGKQGSPDSLPHLMRSSSSLPTSDHCAM
ncbi:hypothetical protein PLICRDRAFT_90685 [Plicaturopsis crispa FD-325 SS-3]|nr:hypothetical protein PLICRDRAFT_90685 [Plicaturopsis crispa FD-325 SS-3]